MEERMEKLEKRIAALEGQAQARQDGQVYVLKRRPYTEDEHFAPVVGLTMERQ
jgi:hypothetical protein